MPAVNYRCFGGKWSQKVWISFIIIISIRAAHEYLFVRSVVYVGCNDWKYRILDNSELLHTSWWTIEFVHSKTYLLRIVKSKLESMKLLDCGSLWMLQFFISLQLEEPSSMHLHYLGLSSDYVKLFSIPNISKIVLWLHLTHDKCLRTNEWTNMFHFPTCFNPLA